MTLFSHPSRQLHGTQLTLAVFALLILLLLDAPTEAADADLESRIEANRQSLRPYLDTIRHDTDR